MMKEICSYCYYYKFTAETVAEYFDGRTFTLTDDDE